MKRTARLIWTAGVFGGLLTGVQALSAGTPTDPPDQRCYVCEWRIDGEDVYQVCHEVLCSEL